ncbi:MAG: hypothetical protein ACYST0_11410 [Planctomycetota bacterium]|jgi:hypothetical protein
MPRPHTLVCLLGVVVGLAGTGLAQKVPVAPLDTRGLQIFPGRGNAGCTGITRLTFGKGADGEALMEVPVSWFQGVGDRTQGSATPVCSIDGMTVVFQDHNGSTAESYGIVIRRRASKGGPDMTAAPILQLTNLSSPTAGSGVRGWAIQTLFKSGSQPTPKTIPCRQTLFFGMSVPKDNDWPKDGISLYEARYPEGAAIATDLGDFARVSRGATDPVPNLLWSVTIGKAPTNELGYRGLSMPFSLVASGPVLQAGAGHLFRGKTQPGFGAAGVFPDIKRSPTGDGLVLRVTDNGNRTQGGTVLIFVALGTNGSPPVLGGLKGRVYLGSNPIFLLAGTLTKGSADTLFEIAGPKKIPTALIGTSVYFQGATQGSSPSTAAITNLVGVSY